MRVTRMKRAHPFGQEILRCPRDYDGQKHPSCSKAVNARLMPQRAQLPASEFLMQRSDFAEHNTGRRRSLCSADDRGCWVNDSRRGCHSGVDGWAFDHDPKQSPFVEASMIRTNRLGFANEAKV